MSETPTLDEHRQLLRAGFLEWLLLQNPEEVLDLGAGPGTLVSELTEAGVRASGIEQSSQALERARRNGASVAEGHIDGPSTVFPSAAWIVVRHVLHHVENPARVLLRAAAAAETGILVAEPFVDEGFPCSPWLTRLEALTRRLDRRSGMIHGPNLKASEISSMLPSDWSIEVRSFFPVGALPSEEADVLIQRSARGEALDPGDAKERDLILAAAKDGLLCPSGSVAVMAKRPKSL